MKAKRVLSFLIVFMMVFSIPLSTGIISFAAAMEGAGTEASPYLIKTSQDLYSIDGSAAYYQLANDINLENLQRQPIPSFKGTLDGNGHKIYNVHILGESYVGLFGTLTNAIIKNLSLEDLTIKSNGSYVGVLAGNSSNCSISNVSVNNGLLSASSYIGGFFGSSSDLTLFKCSTSIKVEASASSSGGLIGSISGNNSIKQCSVTGNIQGYGFIGSMASSSSYKYSITDSYFSGTASKNALLGSSNSITIKDCYAVGATFGSDSTTNNTKNSYFDSTIAKITTPLAQARTTEQMKSKSNYVDWDFENIWTIDEGNSYPKLKYETNKGNQPINKRLRVLLEPEEELQLSVDEDLAENEKLIWTSSDSEVVTVDSNGNLTAVKKGIAIITVENSDGTYIEQISVQVEKGISAYRLGIDLKVGKSCRLTIDDTNTLPAAWMSNDTAIAVVTENGRVTAVSAGLALITAKDETGNEIGQVYVRVR